MNESIVNIAGQRTRCFVAGDGSATIVLVHGGAYEDDGIAHSARAWEFNLEALAQAGLRVVAFDTPGYGESPAPVADEQFSVPAQVDHALRMVRAFGGGKVHLAGYGAGAMVAIRAAFAAPELLHTCCIIDGAGTAPAGDPLVNLTLSKPLEPRYSRPAQAWVLERTSFAPHHIAAGQFLAEAVARATTPAFMDMRRRLLQGGVFDRVVRPSAAKARVNTWTRLREEGLPVPALLIWGANDPLAPIENARALFGLIAPRQTVAHLRLIGRAGAMPFREQPASFNEILGGFIRAIR
jgi:pimeloyl-ACP methyl ester carboxylesterase